MEETYDTSKEPDPHPGWRRRFLESIGLYGLACRLREFRHAFPLRFTNFVCQRLVGLNCECPWRVHFTSTVTSPERMRIHPSVYSSFELSGGCYIQGVNGIEIGEGTLFAPGVKIISGNHNREDYDRWVPAEPIRIGPHCWLGANAVILPGVQLGPRVVVGAGAVVTKSFPEGSVVAGVPARGMSSRNVVSRSSATDDPGVGRRT